VSTQAYTPEELEQKLRAIGPERYHHKHPFHLMMHEGKLTQGQMQAWAFNRYYYQAMIPVKDAVILSRSTDPGFRRQWRKRIEDHDGTPERPDGGIEKWIRLAQATGLAREQVVRGEGILPGVRFAVDAYLDLVSKRTFLEAVASSLTELFSRDLISFRIVKLRTLYPWLDGGLEYFEARLTQAPEDAAMALDYVCRHARTREQQDAAIAALRVKCEILWTQLDAIHYSYVSPGLVPPGSFKPSVA
jgi:coenzyme PQQ biosynthesis protein C